MIKFLIEEGRLVIDPLLLTIPHLKRIYERDKSRTKTTAIDELTYVFHMASDKGPYADMDYKEREVYLKKQFFKDSKPDVLVEQAITEYFRCTVTAEDRVVLNLRKKIDQLNDFIEKCEDIQDDKKRAEMVKAINNIEEISAAIDKIMERREKDKKIPAKIRGKKKLSFIEETDLNKKNNAEAS